MTFEQKFQSHRAFWYVLLKWSVTAPTVFVGNILDLCTLNYAKRIIDVTPLMTSGIFGSPLTQAKEAAYAENCFHPFVNRGFAGALRAVVSVILEIPLQIASFLLAGITSILSFIFEALCCQCAPVLCDNLSKSTPSY